MNDELERERKDALEDGLSDAHCDMTGGSPRFAAECANSPVSDMSPFDASRRSSSDARSVMRHLGRLPSPALGAVRALLCLVVLVALLVPRADRAQSQSLSMQVIAGLASPVNLSSGTCPSNLSVCILGGVPYGVEALCKSPNSGIASDQPTSPVAMCSYGYSGDGGGAVGASLNFPISVAADANGNVYFADAGNEVVRKIDSSGNISTYGWVDANGNFILGAIPSADISCYTDNTCGGDTPGLGRYPTTYPSSVAVDSSGAVHVEVASGGSGGIVPLASAIDSKGNDYSLDEQLGAWFAIAGNGQKLFCTTSTTCTYPVFQFDTYLTGLAVDPAGNLYTIEILPGTISLVQMNPNTGGITTIPVPGASSSVLENTWNPVAADSRGNLYVLAGAGPSSVVEYNPQTQTWTTIAGTATNGFNNGTPLSAPTSATSTDLNNVTGISVGLDGALYIADTGNNLIRKIAGVAPPAVAGCSECGPTTMAITDQISRPLPSSWAFDPTLHKLYMITSTTPGVVTAFDTTNDTVLDNISFGATSSINMLALDSTNNLVYIGDQANNVVYVIGANTDQPVTGSPVSLPGAPGSIATLPGSSRAYITIANGGYSYPSPSLPAVAVVAGPSLSNPSATYLTGIGAYDSGTSLAGASAIIADPQRDRVYVRFLGTIGTETAYSLAEIDASSTGNNAVTTYELSIASNFSSVYSDSMAINESTGDVMIADDYDQYVHLFEYSTQTLSGIVGGSGGFFNYHVAADSINGIFYTWDGYGNVGYLIPNQASGAITSTSVFGNSGLTSVAVDSSTEQAYIVNCNTANADGTLGTVTLWDGLKKSVSTTLPLEIPSTATGETCGPMFVDASGSNPAAHSAWMSYNYNLSPSGGGGGIDVINGPAPAARPVISVSPTSLSFGTAGVGQGSFVTNVTIQNNGTAPLNGVTPIFEDAQDRGSIQVNNTFSGPSTCGAPVAPGGSCVIYLQFTPSQVENFSGSILFLDNSPDTPQSMSVTGAGVPATGPLTISPLAFSPGVVNQPYSEQVLVSGLVGAPSFNLSGSVPPGLSFSGTSLSGTPTQAGTYNFTITATDTATGKSGSQFYSLTITSTAAGQTQVSMSGAGVSGVVPFGSIEFAEPSATLQIQLEDTGLASVYANLQITGATLAGPNADDFIESDNCVGQFIAEFSRCTINVTFKPGVQPTANEVAQLILSGNAALPPIFLTGTSAAPLGAPASLPVAISVDNGNPSNLASTSSSGSCYPPECGGSTGTSLGAISSGGKFVGFSFAASNLPGPPPPNSSSQPEGAYLRNTCIGAPAACEQSTQYISYGPTTGPAANGGQPCNGSPSTGGSVSTNVTGIDSTGQYVLFETNGCAFSSQTFQNATQIFLRDVINGVTSLISIDPTNSVVLGSGASHSSMSNNGDFFAFASSSTNADANFGNPNSGSEVYWRGCRTLPLTACAPSTVIVSQDNVNDSANDSAGQPSISASGRFVAFSSTATQLTELSGPLQNNVAGTANVFLWDSCASTAVACTPHTILISQNASGNAVGGSNPSVSSDGRFVVFLSTAPTLLPTADQAQFGGTQEVYLVDTCLSNGTPVSGCQSQPPILVSQLNGVPGNVGSTSPTISADGASILFSSGSATLTTLTLFNQSPVYKYTNCLSAAAPLNCAASLQIISVDANGNPIQNVSSSGAQDPTGQYFTFGEQQISGGVPITEIYLGPTMAPIGPLTITTLGLPNAIVRATYSQTINATGAGAPATFAVSVGALPPGLTLSIAGTLSGTPTTPGVYDFTITALGTAAQTAQQAYQVTIYPPLSVAPTSLPNGLVGSAYSQTLTATGGTGTGYSWSVVSGSGLSAAGLTLSPAGLISGTPMATESAGSVTVQVTDSGGFAFQQVYQLTVTNPAPTLVSIAVTPANPMVSAGSTEQFTATGVYSDTTTQDLTASVVWISSNTSVATISSSGGLATAIAAGSSTMTATLGSMSGSTTLTVPLSISEPVTVADSVSVVPLTLEAPIQVAAPVAYFTQGSPLGFNSITGRQQVVGIENIGETGTSLTLTSVAISTGAHFSVSSANCFNGATTAAIRSGSFCTVTVTYTGSSATDTGTLVFTDNAGLSNLNTSGASPNFTQSIILNATGGPTAPPAAPLATVTIPTINETITVSDTETFPEVVDTEPIMVIDTISVRPGPIVTAISPSSGPPTGGTSVTITGAGFTGATAVNFGSAPAATFTVNSDTQATAISPAGTGTINVTVITAVAMSASSAAGQFTYATPKVGGSARIALGAGTYNVTITLTNNSTYPLSELTLLKATLGSTGALTFPSGTILTNLAPAASGTLTATFSTSAGLLGQTVPLTLSGTYTAGSLSGSWTLGFRSVTLP